MKNVRLSKLQKIILIILHENNYYVYGHNELFRLIVNKFQQLNMLTLNKRSLSVSLSRSLINLEDKGYIWFSRNYCNKRNWVQLNIVDDRILEVD